MTPRTLVFIPPGELHAIRDIGNEPLIYVTATVPPFEPHAAAPIFVYNPPPEA